MQFSSSAYMGVETLVRLAVEGADKPCSTRTLAGRINRSVSFTEGLMARLRKAGLVVSRHGPGGGYVLAKPADQITVADVFEAVDTPSDIASHPLSADAFEDDKAHDIHGTDLLWASLKSHVLAFLNGVSLADLAPESARPFHPARINSMLRH